MPLQVTGVREALAAHQEMARRARDLTPVMQANAADAQRVIDGAWARQVSPAGVQWPPLREPDRTPGNSLQRAARVIAGRFGVLFDVALPYARFRFWGRRGTPARNPLPIEPIGAGLYTVPATGEAGAWLARCNARVRAYLTLADRPSSGGGARR